MNSKRRPRLLGAIRVGTGGNPGHVADCAMNALRIVRLIGCAAVFVAGTCAASTAASLSFDPDDVFEPAFPARPASVRELPPSRVRIHADVTYGIADPHAVAAFKAGRLGIALRSGTFGSNTVVHAGQGFYLDGTSSDSYGVYANHTVYPKMREPGNPNGGAGFLYAPTFFGPGADCIEAVTVTQNAEPQVWAWDWCAANPNPYAIVNVDKTFKKSYIRLMPDGYPEYTVETILASDGVTWDMNLYNYKTKQWDIIYQTSGARNPNYGLGQQGWNFFETYTNVT